MGHCSCCEYTSKLWKCFHALTADIHESPVCHCPTTSCNCCKQGRVGGDGVVAGGGNDCEAPCCRQRTVQPVVVVVFLGCSMRGVSLTTEEKRSSSRSGRRKRETVFPWLTLPMHSRRLSDLCSGVLSWISRCSIHWDA